MKKNLIIITIALLFGASFWFENSHYPADRDSLWNMNSMMSWYKNVTGQSLTRLPDKDIQFVKPTEIVELKDGDTFALEATIVKQEVGNRTVKRLAYNGQIPGPILKVQKGAKVTVNFTNNIDMETALHSHGLRGKWEFDGAVPITPAIPVGGSFSYELEFPDTGVFWYHPHVREDYQQEMGLYGNFIVEEDGYWNEVNQEEYLIVDDMLEKGEFDEGNVTNTLMGRFGDTLLINDSENYKLTVKAGEVTRLFVTNVANTRTFDLKFVGALTKLVGGDIGRLEHEVMIDHQIIAPAERYIVELYYKTPGTYTIEHRGAKIGTVNVEASNSDKSLEFAKLRTNKIDYETIRNNTDTLLAQKPDKNLRLDVEMKGMMSDMMDDMESGSDGHGAGGRMMGGNYDDAMISEHCKITPDKAGCEEYTTQKSSEEHSDDGIEWEDNMAMMNQMGTDENIKWIIEDTDTKKKNEEINWSFRQGDLVKIRIYNDEKGLHPMQHPIHFHGQRFVVLTEAGKLSENLQWKDTVLIPKGRTVDILVDMSNAGKWMGHCHIAEHLHSGMMFKFEVKSSTI